MPVDSLGTTTLHTLGLVSLAALGSGSASRTMVTLYGGTGATMNGATTIYVCPHFIPVTGGALHRRNAPRMHVTAMAGFPRNGSSVTVTITRAGTTITCNTSRISIMFPCHTLVTNSRAMNFRLIGRYGRTYNSVLLGMVVRANRLGRRTLVGGTSRVYVRTNTGFVGASANGMPIGTAPRCTHVVLRMVHSVNMTGAINFGPTNNIHATRSTRTCLTVTSSVLNNS